MIAHGLLTPRTRNAGSGDILFATDEDVEQRAAPSSDSTKRDADLHQAEAPQSLAANASTPGAGHGA